MAHQVANVLLASHSFMHSSVYHSSSHCSQSANIKTEKLKFFR